MKTMLPFAIERDSQKNLTDQVSSGLRACIMNGSWKAGEYLPSRFEIARQLEVSENVIRSALARLKAEGLIMPRTKRGCEVLRKTSGRLRGRVLFVLGEDPGAYHASIFSATLCKELNCFDIKCTCVSVPIFARSRPDFTWVKENLDEKPDVVIIESNARLAPGLVRLVESSGIPYVMIMSSDFKCGKHCLAAVGYTAEKAIAEFVRDCQRAHVMSVCQFGFGKDSVLSPLERLSQIGVATEELSASDIGPFEDFETVQRKAVWAMRRRIAKATLCELIFFVDDYLAMGAVPVLLECGVRIPEDVKVVSLANKGFGPVFPKSLARIEFDFAAEAKRIAAGLMEWFRTGRFPEFKGISPTYVRGETFPVAQEHH